MKISWISTLVTSLMCTSAWAQISNDAQSCLAFPIQGENSYGSFRGKIQLDKTGRALRNVQYDQALYGQLQIQELWSGNQAVQNGRAVIQFNPRRHKFLTQLGNSIVASGEEYLQTDLVSYSLKDLQAAGEVQCDKIQDLQNRRVQNEIKPGLKNPALIKLAKFLFIDSVIEWHRKQPALDPYRSHPDYIQKKFYTINDLTDREFYQKNPHSLRLRDVSANEFTLMEAWLRRSAYAFNLDDKAQTFDINTRKYNINSLGLFSYVVGDKIHPDGDSSLWTAMYLASQASRYLVTQNAEAYANFKTALQGLLLLVNVSDDPQSFARAAMPGDGSSEVGAEWKRGQGKYSHVLWLPGGNNDMIKGLFLGFAWAHKVLPAKDPLRAEINQALSKLENVKLKRVNGPNKAYVKGLRFLFNRDERSYDAFIRFYLANQNLTDITDLDRPFYIDGITDWSGTNLNMVGSWSLMLIAEEIAKVEGPVVELNRNLAEITGRAPQAVTGAWIAKQMKRNLHEVHLAMKYAKRDSLCLLAYGVSKEQLGPAPASCWLSLHETPRDLPDVALAFNRQFEADFIFSSIPSLPWKSVLEKQDPIRHLMSNKNYPKFEGDGFASQLMWKENNFRYKGEKAALKHMPRVDYLFSYWTYKYYQGL